MLECAGQVFAELVADAGGCSSRVIEQQVEGGRAFRQREPLAECRSSVGARRHEQEFAQIRYQDAAVALPVCLHLAAARNRVDVRIGEFHLDHAAIRVWRAARGRRSAASIEEAEVGMVLAGQFRRCRDAGVQRPADRIEEIAQRRIVGTLRGRHSADAAALAQVRLECGAECAHGEAVMGWMPAA